MYLPNELIMYTFMFDLFTSRICGSSYDKYTQSVYNTMMVTMETFEVGDSNFKAVVSLINRKSTSWCYV